MKNKAFTIRAPKPVFDKLALIALRQNTSINGLVLECLTQLVSNEGKWLAKATKALAEGALPADSV